VNESSLMSCLNAQDGADQLASRLLAVQVGWAVIGGGVVLAVHGCDLQGF